jgi:hypothetical protein
MYRVERPGTGPAAKRTVKAEKRKKLEVQALPAQQEQTAENEQEQAGAEEESPGFSMSM